MSEDKSESAFSENSEMDLPDFQEDPQEEVADEIHTKHDDSGELAPPPTVGRPPSDAELIDDEPDDSEAPSTLQEPPTIQDPPADQDAPATVQDDVTTQQDEDEGLPGAGELHQFAEPAQFGKPKRRRKRTRRRRMLAAAVGVLLVGTLLGVGLILNTPPAGNGGGTGGAITDTGGTGGQSSLMIPGEGDSGGTTAVKQGDPSKTDGKQPAVPEEPTGLVQDLKDQVNELRDSLTLEQERAEELDRELSKRGKLIKELESEKKNFQKHKDALSAELEKTKTNATKSEQQLTDELNGARDNLVKVQASYEESRAKLIDLREKFDLKERQYQARMASLEKNLTHSGDAGSKMGKLLETQRNQIYDLQNQLDRQQQNMAAKYLDQARKHIMKMSERGSEEHLESALQQLYFAGKVDPKNNRKYRQMAVELLDEQVERLRQRKSRKSTEKDKRYQHYMSLREKLVDA
ncbi:MAG: hypothetical protein QGF00_16135 [Planctomycetota bacterium]|jgi:hypothetical protein|nr:hypothetical protein [Planctomycetota bacterium]MDP7251135.1 hypothetical protein [Planctomycetota bacterium]